MPIYHYQALDIRGKKRNGMMEGHHDREVREKLREKGLMVTKVTEKSSISSKQNLKGDSLLSFSILLAQLLNSGIPLYESLITIEEEFHHEPYHRVILSLCEQVKTGVPLSQAMASFPQSFDRLYCSMIAAGEASGALPLVLDRLTQLLSKSVAMKKKISTALIYPGILAGFALLVIFLLMGFVIPSIESIFAERELNGYTEFVLALSRFVRAYWWIYVPILAGAATWIFYKLRTPAGKLMLERFFLKLPVVRSLMIHAAMSRFCRTMGTLQLGGVSMIQSLQLARETMNNRTLEEEIHQAEQRVVEGSSLSSQLSRSRTIPHMVSRMLAVGEESGNIVTMLNKIADIYEDEMEKYLDRLMALAQPVILIIMGFIIGMVLLAILLPLTDVSSLAGGS